MKTVYIGNGIQQIRDELKITQEDLAERLGISRTLLSFYENGRAIANWELVKRMAEELNCTVGDIYRPAILDMIKRAS